MPSPTWLRAPLPLLLASACSAEVADLRPGALARDAGRTATTDAGPIAATDAGATALADAGPGPVDYPTMCPERGASPLAREVSGARGVDLAPSGDRALIYGDGVITVVALPSGEVVGAGSGRSGALDRSGRARVVQLDDGRLERVREDGTTTPITQGAPCSFTLSPDRRSVFSVVACRTASSGIEVGRLERFDVEDATTTIVDEGVMAGSLRGTPAGVDPPRIAYLRNALEMACGPAGQIRGAEAVEQLATAPRRAPPAPRRYVALEGYTPSGVLLGAEATCEGSGGDRIWDVASDRQVGEGRVFPGSVAVSALDAPWQSEVWRPAAALGARGVVLARGTPGHLTMTYHPLDAAAQPQMLMPDSRSPTATVLRADGADLAAIVATDRLVRVGLAPEPPALAVLASGLSAVTVSADGAQAAFDASPSGDTITLALGGGRAPFTAVRAQPRATGLRVLGFAPASGALLLHDRDGVHAFVGGGFVDLDLAATALPASLVADEGGCWIAWISPSTSGEVVRVVPAPRG